jgi:ligand-binding SRPBCC domain-containing protein
MPTFETSQRFARSREELFDFFTRPGNLLAAAPPDLHLRLEEAPEQLALGALMTVRGKRWGIPHRAIHEITVFEPGICFVEEQRQGPFRRWVHTHRFEETGNEVQVTDRIDFEPPGGILGLTVTTGAVLSDLEWAFAHRKKWLEGVLG